MTQYKSYSDSALQLPFIIGFYHLVGINTMFSSTVLAVSEIMENKTEIQKNLFSCGLVAYVLCLSFVSITEVILTSKIAPF